MTRRIVCLAIVSFLVLGTGYPFHPAATAAYAADEWKAEFDDICGRTPDSMALSKDEVKGLIERCDRLKPRIEKLDESTAKVYQKRLKMCRDLFVFVLESRPQ
jgi:hypothetical protein